VTQVIEQVMQAMEQMAQSLKEVVEHVKEQDEQIKQGMQQIEALGTELAQIQAVMMQPSGQDGSIQQPGAGGMPMGAGGDPTGGMGGMPTPQGQMPPQSPAMLSGAGPGQSIGQPSGQSIQ
jgi:hypothetical protein